MEVFVQLPCKSVQLLKHQWISDIFIDTKLTSPYKPMCSPRTLHKNIINVLLVRCIH
uniref:Uncharacterized protein n=1 Tax=Anguilla anguilla TaxID=7936 RepID=A0A0E9WXH9_ANGAN